MSASADQKLKVAEILLDREMTAADRRYPNNQVPLKYHLVTQSEPDAEKALIIAVSVINCPGSKISTK